MRHTRTFYHEDVHSHAWRSLELVPQHHVPETFVVAAATALTTRTFGRVVANLGWHDVQLPLSVSVGDTIEVESAILETRASRSRPGEGIVSVATHARNQNGADVLSYQAHACWCTAVALRPLMRRPTTDTDCPTVMAGLCPGHPSRYRCSSDGRDKPGHDTMNPYIGIVRF